MESIAFVIIGVALYFAADRILSAIEAFSGRRFEHRTLVFFAVLLVLSLGSFAVIRQFLPLT